MGRCCKKCIGGNDKFFETYNHESQIDLHIGDNHNIQKILSNEKKMGKSSNIQT